MDNFDLSQYATDKAKVFPELKKEIYSLLCLCFDEIADGASPQHEYELFYNSVEELIKNHFNEKNSNN